VATVRLNYSGVQRASTSFAHADNVATGEPVKRGLARRSRAAVRGVGGRGAENAEHPARPSESDRAFKESARHANPYIQNLTKQPERILIMTKSTRATMKARPAKKATPLRLVTTPQQIIILELAKFIRDERSARELLGFMNITGAWLLTPENGPNKSDHCGDPTCWDQTCQVDPFYAVFASRDVVNDCKFIVDDQKSLAVVHGTDCALSRSVAKQINSRHSGRFVRCERLAAGGSFQSVHVAAWVGDIQYV